MIVCNNFYDRLAKHYSLFTQIIPTLGSLVGFKQNNPWHEYDVFLHTYHALEKCESDDIIVKLAVFFHDFGKPHCYQDGEDGVRHFKGHGRVSADMANTILRQLRFDNDTREKVVELVYYHDATYEVGKKYIKRWLNKIGEEQFRRLLDVRKADIRGQKSTFEKERIDKVHNIEKLLNEVIKENECFSLKDLAIDGKDLLTIGYKSGIELGNTLNGVLQMVIDGDIPNDKEKLLQEASRRYNHEMLLSHR